MYYDANLQKLARLLLSHSLKLKSGELFEINGGIAAKPLIKALMAEAHELGAVPFVRLEDDELSRMSFGYIDPENSAAAEAVLAKQKEWELARWKHLAAHVDIGVDENESELAAVDSKALRIHRAAMKEVRDIRIDERRWVYLHWPTMADAQKAGMCWDELYGLFLSSALVDYEAMRAAMEPLKALMERTKEVRITGPGTELSFSIKGMPVVPCFGERNIPDGEIYTAPLRESAEGTVAYNTAASMLGRRYENPRLTFHRGRIVEAACANDSAGLNELLDMDEGARYLGEFALGVNNALTRAIGNTLYDEKIGGSFHLTPGNAYRSAWNGNQSALHLDLVCLQAPPYGGEIWFDGVCVRKDGLFLPEELRGLNPG